MTVEKIDAGARKISRQAVVNAPAAELFALLSDPHRHHEIDGSGTVGAKVKGPTALSDGDGFTVAMKQFGVPYKIKSTVTALGKDRLIEWKHPVGHRWRWELAPVSDSVTTVTETWDASRTPAYVAFKIGGMVGRNEQGITKTLEGLQQRYAV